MYNKENKPQFSKPFAHLSEYEIERFKKWLFGVTEEKVTRKYIEEKSIQY